MLKMSDDTATRVEAVDTLLFEVAASGPGTRVLREAMSYALFPGGKRWRPLLVFNAAEMLGVSWRTATPAAAALELLHASSLVFDDLPCMDDASERRGRPALHLVYGESIAVLTGIALLTTAFGLLRNTPRPRRTLALAAHYLGVSQVLGGQALDLLLQQAGRVPPVRLIQLRNRKTSGLIELAALTGALHGSPNRQQRLVLRRYGRLLGNAFQAIDDDADGDAVGSACIDDQVSVAIDEIEMAFEPNPGRAALVATAERMRTALHQAREMHLVPIAARGF